MAIPEIMLSLDSERKTVVGSAEALNGKITAGADVRISTGFLHNEHIDTASDDDQLIVETSTFAETVLIDGIWSAFFITIRQPVALCDGFGSPNSLSLFLYNQNGDQALGKLILDGTKTMVLADDKEKPVMKKMHTINVLDCNTPGVSKNFIYDFEFYHFIIHDCYKEVYANANDGKRTYGSMDILAEGYNAGRGIKLAVKGLSKVIWGDTGHEDEIYIHCGSSYYYTKDRLMITNTLPFVLVPADIPLRYKAGGYRYCWIVARTDGRVVMRSYNPLENVWETKVAYLPLRWFAQT